MHDSTDQADALNDYLDAVADAVPRHLRPQGVSPEIQESVDRFFDLAHYGGIPHLANRRPSMSAETAQPPRTRQVPAQNPVLPAREQHPLRRFNATHLNTWATGFLTALLIVGMVAGAWLLSTDNFPPATRNHLAAIATEEGTPAAFWQDPISLDEAPWIATIAPEECAAEPLSFEDHAAFSTTDPGAPTGSYDIVGVPTPADAEAVTTVARAWEACRVLTDTDRMRGYVTQEYTFFYSGSTVENAPYQDEIQRRRSEASLSFSHWAADSGFYSLAAIEGVEPPPAALESFEFAQGVLDGDHAYNSFQAPPIVYFESRFNPDETVLLDDGRIMVPTTYVYWAEDPWVQAQGISPDGTLVSSALILKLVEGEWKIDELGIPICIGECAAFFDAPGATPRATPTT
jgi:hypothetical protein